jgi:hypothetical protein
LKPWEFRALNPERAAELAAFHQVEQEIEGYYSSEHARRMERIQNKK